MSLRRRKRRSRSTRRLLLVLTTSLLLVCAATAARHVWILFHSEELLLTPPAFDFRAAREIYPYSVVPGGVFDAQEVADSVAHDSVARVHYAGIEPGRLWAIRAREPILAYVSYRKDQSIHWTTHPLTVASGEVILTDGVNMIRARCGNRLVLKRPSPLPGSVPAPILPPPDIVFQSPLPALTPAVIEPPAPPKAMIAELPRPPTIPPP